MWLPIWLEPFSTPRAMKLSRRMLEAWIAARHKTSHLFT